jgi:hypothetical protein
MAASGSGGPPLPSISVAPTSATPSGGGRRQAGIAAIAKHSVTIANERVGRMPWMERI